MTAVTPLGCSELLVFDDRLRIALGDQLRYLVVLRQQREEEMLVGDKKAVGLRLGLLSDLVAQTSTSGVEVRGGCAAFRRGGEGGYGVRLQDSGLPVTPTSPQTLCPLAILSVLLHLQLFSVCRDPGASLAVWAGGWGEFVFAGSRVGVCFS